MTTLPPIPDRIARLPVDYRGFPVPWFVQWFSNGAASDVGEGEPDFRVADQRKLNRAISEKRCWICGDVLGVRKAFTIGPMCAINRVISEPPQHRECAVFAATACPFLTKPRMKRNEKGIPAEAGDAAGIGLKRNPGVACVWITRKFRPFRAKAGNAGILFSLGDPDEVLWFCEGRAATRAEVMASIDSGYPALVDMAKSQGSAAIDQLEYSRTRAMTLLPATEAAA